MIIFLYGDDIYRLSENREAVIKSYQAKHGSGFNFFRIDGSSPSALADVTEALKSFSLFSEVKLVLVSNVFSRAETAEGIHELLKKYAIATDPKIVVLATHGGAVSQAKPKELFTFLSNPKNLVRDFGPMEGVKLQNWIKKEAEARGAVFASGALNHFMAVAGTDSWARIQNLAKLSNYCASPTRATPEASTRRESGEGGLITPETIDLLIKTETEPNVFQFIDALGSGQRAQAFSLLCGELAYGRDPYYLLSMVMYQFRNMLMVKDFADRNIPAPQIAQKAGIHPFVVKKMLSSVSRLSLADMKRLYQEVIDLEQGTKQGRRDLEDGLFSLALG